MSAAEVEFWKHVAQDLGIEVIAPFEITLPDSFVLTVSAFVPCFGAARGMLVDNDYGAMRPHTQVLVKLGFGYSTQLGGTVEAYRRDVMIEVLADWGWSGALEKKPSWLPPPSN